MIMGVPFTGAEETVNSIRLFQVLGVREYWNNYGNLLIIAPSLPKTRSLLL
jgi:hypothetical protein